MNRKLPIFAFALVLIVTLFNPTIEAKIDISRSVVAPLNQVPSVSYSDAAAPAVALADENSDEPLTEAEPEIEPIAEPIAEPEPTPLPTPAPTPMTRGLSGPEVMTLQAQLLSLGFLNAEPDGIYGKDTESAVMKLQAYLNTVERNRGTAVPEHVPMGYGVALADEAPSADPYPENGVYDGKLMEALKNGDFPVYIETGIALNSTGSEAMRVQARLNSLKYIYKGVDGAFGQKSVDALTQFQRVNGLPQTGIADETTLNMLYSPLAIENDEPLHPYQLIVSVKKQRVYVYAWNNGKYDKLLKTFKCSTGLSGTPTPLGTFTDGTGPGKRWHYFTKFNVWAQYAYYIEGDILFHSVLFNRKGGSATSSSVYNLGKRASHGCVRLAVNDAKWIWQNAPVGTTVIVKK